jgi:hypothetical protein
MRRDLARAASNCSWFNIYAMNAQLWTVTLGVKIETMGNAPSASEGVMIKRKGGSERDQCDLEMLP